MLDQRFKTLFSPIAAWPLMMLGLALLWMR